MTLEEAHAYIEGHCPEFALECIGGKWVTYKWIAPAGEYEHEFAGSFIEAVQKIKEWQADSANGDDGVL